VSFFLHHLSSCQTFYIAFGVDNLITALPWRTAQWGLYNDNLRRAAPDSPKPTDTQISQFSTGRRGSDISGPWDDRESEDIEFKALPEPRNPFRA
jgi:hypothetical protein